jgi:hypothetical protein
MPKMESRKIIHRDSHFDVPRYYSGCVVYPNQSKEWYLNGKVHREDGPAREWLDGTKQWYFNDYYFWGNTEFLLLEGNYIVVERGIQTDKKFGNLKLTQAKLLMAEGTMFVYDNLPGFELKEGNE